MQAKLTNGLQQYSGGFSSYVLPVPTNSMDVFNPLTTPSYQQYSINFFPNINYSQIWLYSSNSQIYLDDVSLEEIPGIIRVNGQSNILCGTTQFQSIVPSAYYNWSSSTGNISISGSGNTINITPTGSGNATLCVQTDKGSFCIQFVVGPPQIQFKTVNAVPSQPVNIINNPATLGIASQYATGINWSVFSGNGTVIPGGTQNGFSAAGYANNFVSIKAQAFNQCGNGDSYFFYLQKSGTSLMKIGPNPATTTLSLNFVDGLPDTLLPENVTLYDKNKKVHFTHDIKKLWKGKDFKNKSFDIDVSKIPRGNYFLHVYNNNYSDDSAKTEMIQIILD